jgi:hypothetical protein
MQNLPKSYNLKQENHGNDSRSDKPYQKAQDPYASVMKEDLARINKLLDEILKNITET